MKTNIPILISNVKQEMFLQRVMTFASFVSVLIMIPLHVSEASDLCSALSNRFANESNHDPRPELCFDGKVCLSNGVNASTFWRNSNNPNQIQSELNAHSDRIGLITEAQIPHQTGSIVQIARRVGTANCVRDSYLYKVNGHYQLIKSVSLDALSGEASYCGSDFVKLISDSNRNIVAVRSGTTFYAYDITPPAFELKQICIKNDAFRSGQ